MYRACTAEQVHKFCVKSGGLGAQGLERIQREVNAGPLLLWPLLATRSTLKLDARQPGRPDRTMHESDRITTHRSVDGDADRFGRMPRREMLRHVQSRRQDQHRSQCAHAGSTCSVMALRRLTVNQIASAWIKCARLTSSARWMCPRSRASATSTSGVTYVHSTTKH